MEDHRRFASSVGLALALALVCCGGLRAQEDADFSLRMEVIQLKHAPALDLVRVVQETFHDADLYVVVDPRTNSFIVKASPRDLDQVRSLISQLDVEVRSAEHAPRRSDARSTITLPLYHRKARELLPNLSSMVTGLMIADEKRNLIVFSGDENSQTSLRSLIEVFDVAPVGLTLELMLMAPGGTPLSNSPENSPLHTELARLDLAGYGVQDQVRLRTLANETFKVGSSGGLALEADGRAQLDEDSQHVSLELHIEARDKGLSDEPAQKPARTRLSTTLRLPIGDRVLVGLTTTGDVSAPLVLVARVALDPNQARLTATPKQR